MATIVAGTASTGISTSNTSGSYTIRFTDSGYSMTPAAPETELDRLDKRVNAMRVKL